MNKKYLIFFTTLFLITIWTQEKADLPGFSNVALMDRAKEVKVSLQNPQKVLNDTQNTLQSLQKAIENIEEQLKKARPVENLADEAKYLSSLLSFLLERETLYAEVIPKWQEYVRHLTEAQQRGTVVLKIVRQLDLLQGEIVLRLNTKAIKEEDVPEEYRKYDVVQAIKEREILEKNLEKWEINKQQAGDKIEQFKKSLEDISKEIKTIQKKSILTKKEQLFAQQRQKIQQDFEKKEIDTLMALASSSFLELPKSERATQEKITLYQKQKDKLKTLEQDIPVPSADDIKLELKSKVAMEAEKKWKYAQKLLTYQVKKKERLEQQKLLLEEISAELENLSKISKEYLQAMVQLDVIIKILQEKKADISKIEKQPYDLKIKKQKNLIYLYDAEQSEYLQKKQDIQTVIAQIKELILEQQQKIVVLEKTYKEEKKWEQWVTEAEKLDNEQLQVTLAESLESAKINKKQSELLLNACMNTEGKIVAQELSILRIRSPLVAKAQQSLQQLYSNALESVEAIAKQKKYEISLKLERHFSKETQEEFINKLIIISRGYEDKSSTYFERFGQQLDFFSGIVSVFKSREKGQYQLQVLLNRNIRQYKNLIKQEENIAKELRKAYGAALEFQIRLGKKQIEKLPEIVAKAPSKSDLLLLDEEISKRQEQINDMEKLLKKGERQKNRIKTIVTFLENRISKILEKLEHLRKRTKFEKKFDTKELTDTEKQRFEQEIYEKKIADSHWWENLLSFFHSSNASKHESLLDAYYKDFVSLEEKIKNLNKRIVINKSLLKVTEKEQEILSGYMEKDIEVQIEQQIKEQLAKIEAKIKPKSLHSDIVQEFPEIKLPSSLTNEELSNYIPKAADEVFRFWVYLLVNKAWEQSIKEELSKLGLEAEMAKYVEDMGHIESKKRQIQPELNVLIGYSQESLKELDNLEKPENKSRYLKGEIEYTRKLRLNALLNSAFFSILSLIFIPIIAYMLIRFMNKAGENLIATAVGVTYKKQRVREQRISTLTGILKTISITVIVAIACVYMLKQFNIDITPIIASAGILGLALAFGAQALVRDYFSGFFILLENQYATGDLVEIADVVGYIHRVTMRLTVVQSVDGTMHYFPNGTIQHVSNKSKNSRAVIMVGVSYNQDVDKVLRILNEVAQDMQQDPHVGKMVLEEYEVSGLDSFDNSSMTYRMWIKTTPGDQWTVKRATQRRIKIYFDKYNVEIPFPQRVLHNPKPSSEEVLKEKEDNIKERFQKEKEKLISLKDVKKIQATRNTIKENMEITSEEEAKKAEEKIDQIVEMVDDMSDRKKHKKHKKKNTFETKANQEKTDEMVDSLPDKKKRKKRKKKNKR